MEEAPREEEKDYETSIGAPLEYEMSSAAPEESIEDLEEGEKARMRIAALESDNQETMDDDVDEGVSDRSLVSHTPMGAMSSVSGGTLFKRKDGTVVRGGSKQSVDKYLNKRGWSNLDDMRKEALAYKEALLVEKGITLSDGSRVFVDQNNPEHVKLYTEQHKVRIYGTRDMQSEPAPGYSDEESVGRYVATDQIAVTPRKDLPELITPVKGANDGPIGAVGRRIPDMIGPLIPVQRTIFDASEENDLPTVERTLLFGTLINLPVMTPRLLCLIIGAPLPVISDSFEIIRKYLIYFNVAGSKWLFDRHPQRGYFDTEEQVIEFQKKLEKADTWLLSIEDADRGGPGASTDPKARNPKTGKKKAMRSRNFAQWFVWLPDWFKNALKTSIDGESYMRNVHKLRNGKVPNDRDLEEIMAEFAWHQYQMRKKYLTLRYNASIDRLKETILGSADAQDSDASHNAEFLGNFLELTYERTMETIRAMETLILRWSCKYIPVNYWEWLMSPRSKPEPRLVTDLYKVPSFIYRKQNEAIRDYMMNGDIDRFRSICSEGSMDEMMKPEEERKDTSPKNEYDGVSLISLSRLYEFINFESHGKCTVEQMSQRVYEIMEKVDRMNVTPVGDYTPDPKVLEPLIKKLDDGKIPNLARPDYLKTKAGEEFNKIEEIKQTGSFDESSKLVRHRDDEEGKEKEGKRTRQDESGEDEEEVMVESF